MFLLKKKTFNKDRETSIAYMYNNCTFYEGQDRYINLVHDKVDDIKLCLHNKIMSV